MRDIRVTLRALAAQPGFTATVVLTLALALGASGAVFSVVHAVLLRPLPFAAPDRVVVLGEFSPASATTFVAPVTFDDWRTRQSVFDEIAAFRYWETVNFEDGASEPEPVTLATGSENLFRALGIRPLLGRTYREEQRREGGSEAVISHELWKWRYASDPAVLGRVVRIRGTPTTIVGVMPPMPTALSIGWGDLWTCLYRYDVPQMRATKYRSRYLTVVGRLRADVSLDQATTKMQALQRQLWTEPTSVAEGFDVHLQPLADVLTGGVRLPLLVVSGAVVLLLLVAYANVVTLISVRAASRGREIATRLALGAEPLHVLRLMALEGFMLALAGGAGGLAVTWVALRGLSAVGSAIPRFNDAAVGVEVVAFSIVLALAIAVLCSIVPVLQVGRGDVAATLAESGRSGTDGPQTEWLRQGLVVLQIALACLLLTSGSLLLRSFANVLRVDPGFDSRRAVYFDLYLPDSRYPDAAAYTRFYRELVRRFEVEPGTEAAGALLYFPYKPKLWPVSVEVQGAPVPAGEEPIAYFNQIAGGYFRAMGIPLVSGRLPTEREIWDRSASPAIVINKTMARQLFGDSNPIGRRVRSGPTAAWNEIIGVVGDVRQQRLDIPPAAEYYTTFQQMPMPFQSVVVRAKRDRSVSIGDVRAVMRQLDAGVALANLMPLEQWVRMHTRERQFALLILAAFGGLAVALGAIGVYGAASYAVSRRQRDIGIRVALGATPREIIAMVLAHGMTLAATGVAAGIVLGFGLGRFVRAMLYDVSAADPLTFSGVPLALLVVAALACYLPARRATRIDPLVALRAE